MRVIRAFVILLLLVVVAVFAWGLFAGQALQRGERPVDTARAIDVDAARQRGAELGEKAALATAKVQETIDEAGITGKIKAKLALDDYVGPHDQRDDQRLGGNADRAGQVRGRTKARGHDCDRNSRRQPGRRSPGDPLNFPAGESGPGRPIDADLTRVWRVQEFQL